MEKSIKNILHQWENHISKDISEEEIEILINILKKICINEKYLK